MANSRYKPYNIGGVVTCNPFQTIIFRVHGKFLGVQTVGFAPLISTFHLLVAPALLLTYIIGRIICWIVSPSSITTTSTITAVFAWKPIHQVPSPQQTQQIYDLGPKAIIEGLFQTSGWDVWLQNRLKCPFPSLELAKRWNSRITPTRLGGDSWIMILSSYWLFVAWG